jgi:hypothetical protein
MTTLAKEIQFVDLCSRCKVVVMSVVVVVVDMLDCSVDTAELLHTYFLYVSAGRLFSKIPYHTPDKSQTSRELLKKLL